MPSPGSQKQCRVTPRVHGVDTGTVLEEKSDDSLVTARRREHQRSSAGSIGPIEGGAALRQHSKRSDVPGAGSERCRASAGGIHEIYRGSALEQSIDHCHVIALRCYHES